MDPDPRMARPASALRQAAVLLTSHVQRHLGSPAAGLQAYSA